jgi:hypothetical protein
LSNTVAKAASCLQQQFGQFTELTLHRTGLFHTDLICATRTGTQQHGCKHNEKFVRYCKRLRHRALRCATRETQRVRSNIVASAANRLQQQFLRFAELTLHRTALFSQNVLVHRRHFCDAHWDAATRCQAKRLFREYKKLRRRERRCATRGRNHALIRHAIKRAAASIVAVGAHARWCKERAPGKRPNEQLRALCLLRRTQEERNAVVSTASN